MIKNFGFKIIVSLILSVIIINILIFNTAYAIDSSYMKPDQFDDSSYNWIETRPIGNNTVGGIIVKFLGVVLTLLRIVAVGWAIIMAISIAIKYMSGNDNIKAQIKVDMPTYLMGTVLLFGAAGLLKIIQYFVEDVLVVK